MQASSPAHRSVFATGRYVGQLQHSSALLTGLLSSCGWLDSTPGVVVKRVGGGGHSFAMVLNVVGMVVVGWGSLSTKSDLRPSP